MSHSFSLYVKKPFTKPVVFQYPTRLSRIYQYICKKEGAVGGGNICDYGLTYNVYEIAKELLGEDGITAVYKKSIDQTLKIIHDALKVYNKNCEKLKKMDKKIKGFKDHYWDSAEHLDDLLLDMLDDLKTAIQNRGLFDKIYFDGD